MKKSLIVFSVVILLASMIFLLTNISFVSAEGCKCDTDCSVVEGCTGKSGTCEKDGVPSCSSCDCPSVNLNSVNTGLTSLMIKTASGNVKVEPGQTISAALRVKEAATVSSRTPITTTGKRGGFLGLGRNEVRVGEATAKRSSSAYAGWTEVDRESPPGGKCFIQSASSGRTGAVIKWWGNGKVIINEDNSIMFTTQD
ncbi:MAG: hypothetical protein QT10_C0008G0008 [archaeon GW2011_AR19]|nr:MAG: hypothetical protein QT10_C0008G0008 [archaeon GW2011_AR19]